MIVSKSEARGPTVCVYSVIVERLAGGIIGVKHGVAAFVIKYLECCFDKYAATCCYLVDIILLVVRDSYELRIWQVRISSSSFRRIYIHILPGMAFYLIAGRSLAGDRTHKVTVI